MTMLEQRPAQRTGAIQQRWDANLARVAAFAADHGRPPSVVERPALSEWMALARRKFAAGSLTCEQRAALESVPGWWWCAADRPRSDRHALAHWMERAEQAGLFATAHARPPRQRSSSLEERSLAVWLSAQAKRRARGELADWQADLLDALLPGWCAHGEH